MADAVATRRIPQARRRSGESSDHRALHGRPTPTGTLSALYRLEYDGWTPEEALRNVFVQLRPSDQLPRAQPDHLRAPRPSHGGPMEHAQNSLRPEARRTSRGGSRCARPRASCNAPVDGPAMSELQSYLAAGKPFALTVAERVVDTPAHPLAADATKLARNRLDRHWQSPWKPRTMPKSSQPRRSSPTSATPMPRHICSSFWHARRDTVAPIRITSRGECGVTNRYTPNRIAFLRPLLDDRRSRIGPSTNWRYRYCDTAVIRLAGNHRFAGHRRLVGRTRRQERPRHRA